MEDTITESVSVTSPATVVKTQPGPASDTIQATITTEGTRAVPGTASDSVVSSDALAFVWGSILREVVQVSSSVAPVSLYNLSLSDALTVAERLLAGVPVTVADSAVLSSAAQSLLAVSIAEQIGAGSALLGALVAQTTVAELMDLQDSLTRFFGASVLDSFITDSEFTGYVLGLAAIAETVQMDAVLTPQMLVSVTAADTVEVTAAEALNMIFSGTATEAVEVRAGYVSPQGNFTTWAMNTLTAEVSEYSNYAFTGFAKLGNKYVATADDGLYELVGDTDDGTDIIATLRGGYLQFGGTHLSRLGAAYIGVRGGGEYILKIETADGATYTYAVDAVSGRNSKVHMGKGQRARYFSYELTSTGQDFDLDSIEFVPIVVARRV